MRRWPTPVLPPVCERDTHLISSDLSHSDLNTVALISI